MIPYTVIQDFVIGLSVLIIIIIFVYYVIGQKED